MGIMRPMIQTLEVVVVRSAAMTSIAIANSSNNLGGHVRTATIPQPTTMSMCFQRPPPPAKSRQPRFNLATVPSPILLIVMEVKIEAEETIQY